MAAIRAFAIALCLFLSSSASTFACCGQDKRSLDELNTEGINSYRKGDYVKAEEAFKAALDEAYTKHEQHWVGSLLSNLAAVYEAQGNSQDAERLLLEAKSVKNKAAGISEHKPKSKHPTKQPEPFSDPVAFSSLNGYVSQSTVLRRSMLPATAAGLQSLPGRFDPSFSTGTAVARERANMYPNHAGGAADWGPWPEQVRIPPPEPFVASAPPPRRHHRPPFDHHPPGSCPPCQQGDGFLILLRVQGYGAFVGPGGGGGPFRLFDTGDKPLGAGYF